MPLEGWEIERRILVAIPNAQIELIDMAGDKDHWSVTVTSPTFVGMTRVAQHQMVYNAIGPDMGGTLHALKVTTKVAR